MESVATYLAQSTITSSTSARARAPLIAMDQPYVPIHVECRTAYEDVEKGRLAYAIFTHGDEEIRVAKTSKSSDFSEFHRFFESLPNHPAWAIHNVELDGEEKLVFWTWDGSVLKHSEDDGQKKIAKEFVGYKSQAGDRGFFEDGAVLEL